jgi:hypothetical protein
MRKLVFIVFALILAAMVWMFAPARSSPSPVAPDKGASAADSQRDSGSPDAAPSSAGLRIHVGDARLAIDVSERTASVPEFNGTNRCTLRVVVRFAQADDFVPNHLDVYLFDSLGQSLSFDRREDNTFLFTDLAPGSYLVDVHEASSTPTTVRVNLDVPGEVRRVEIAMSPLRCISIHWRTPDGRPFVQAVVAPSRNRGETVMEVCASHQPLQQDTKDKSPRTFASDLIVAGADATYDLITGLSAWGGTGIEGPGTKFDDAFDPSEPGRFCRLYTGAKDELWLSVWCDGILSGSQHVAEDQTTVIFTTPLNERGSSGVPVSLCLVDDKTSLPVTKARIDTDRGTGGIEPDPRGCCFFELRPGWTVLYVDCDPDAGGWVDGMRFVSEPAEHRRSLATVPARLARLTLRIFARRGEPIDLGVIRVPRARVLRFRVLDPDMHPLSDFEIELARMSSYDRMCDAYERRRGKSDRQGFVTFEVSASETYVVGCTGGSLDAAPLAVDAGSVPDDPEAIAGRILVRPSRKVTVAFEPRPAIGTTALIETPDGLPVCSDTIDETGFMSVMLAGSDYTVHLVEDGKVGRDARFFVTSDPFMFTMHR